MSREVLCLRFNRRIADKVRATLSCRSHLNRVVDRDLLKPQTPYLCAVLDDVGELICLGIGVTNRQAAVEQVQLKILDIHAMHVPYDEERALSAISEDECGLGWLFAESVEILLAEEEWNCFVQYAVDGPDSVMAATESLRRRIEEYVKASSHSRNDLEVFERDAIGTALEIGMGANARKDILIQSAKPRDDAAPFLSSLPNAYVREDTAIINDLNVFPGFDHVGCSPVAAVQYSNAGSRFTIVNCNRQILEETIGVDLLYYSHHFKSFTFVQYKQLRKEGSEHVYRPSQDGSLDAEIERINRVRDNLSQKHSDHYEGYRLNCDPFFFKLCKAANARLADNSLSQGFYIPFALWDATSRISRGPRGGVAIGWNTCQRRLSNTHFMHLVQNGWVGSPFDDHNYLNTIVRGALTGKRMVIVAGSQPYEEGTDRKRDAIGQFVSENTDV